VKRIDSAIYGFFAAAGVVCLVQAIIFFVGSALLLIFKDDQLTGWGVFLFYSPGWTQLLYLPFLIRAKLRQGFPRSANGATVFAMILFLLNSACNAMFWPYMFH
jgi:hypothetical protein